jgi:hypothetical protein
VSPEGVLHVVPSDREHTLSFSMAHGLRHAYARNMMDLDEHKARDEASGWVLLGNETWIQHDSHGVILAATGPSQLVKNGATICEGAGLSPSALSVDHSSAKMLFVGVRPCQILPAAHAGPGTIGCAGGSAGEIHRCICLK